MSVLFQRVQFAEELRVQLFASPSGRLGGLGRDGLDLPCELVGAPALERPGDAHVDDLAAGRDHHFDRIVRRVHRHGMRRHDLLELTAQLIEASITVDGLVDPRLVDFARHPRVSSPRVSTPSLSGTRPYPEWSPLRY